MQAGVVRVITINVMKNFYAVDQRVSPELCLTS